MNKWVYNRNHNRFYCEKCGKPMYSEPCDSGEPTEFANFCWYCGADMRDRKDVIMTNYDRLIKMSEEEIYKFIGGENMCNEIPFNECVNYGDCEDCKIEWLKKEYKGDANND